MAKKSQELFRAKGKEEKHIKYVLSSLQYSPLYKIGLTNFGATKMWEHFWNSNHFELWPTFLEVPKMMQGFQNP